VPQVWCLSPLPPHGIRPRFKGSGNPEPFLHPQTWNDKSSIILLGTSIYVQESSMIASNAMTANPLTISQNAKVEDAIKLFRSSIFHDLPVIDDDGKPAGCISALTILHAAVPAYASEKLLAAMEGGPDIVSVYHNLEKITGQPIAEIMDKNIHPVHGDTPTSAVAAMLTSLRHDTSSILVVDDQGRLIGTISARDIVCRTPC